MAISAHTTRSIFDRYNIVSEAGLREAVDRTHIYRKTKTDRARKGVTTEGLTEIDIRYAPEDSQREDSQPLQH